MEKIWDASHDVDFQNWLAFLDSGSNFCGGVIYFKLELIRVFFFWKMCTKIAMQIKVNEAMKWW